VISRVLAKNKASIRMNEKAGYVKEAYLKDELYIDGKYEDLILFGAINPR
jgi:RimJ/RimL family protein N-acetyltransferase